LCGANTLDQNSDTLYQYDEGQRAHTIKFMPNQTKNQTDLNKVNNINNINNLKKEIPKNSLNQNNNKEKLNINKSPKDSNKCSNNASELEIIEYPMKECVKNDSKNLNDILISQAKDYIYDKTQDDIIDYLKGKKGLNYLSLFLENDKDKDNNDDDNDNNDKNKNDDQNDILISPEFKNSFQEINNKTVIGKLVIMKSGKLKIKMGDIYFDVNQGCLTKFAQFATVITENKDNQAYILGQPLNKKLIVTPEFD
jgi:hypothetical protein